MGEKGTISKMSVEGDLGVTQPAYNRTINIRAMFHMKKK